MADKETRLGSALKDLVAVAEVFREVASDYLQATIEFSRADHSGDDLPRLMERSLKMGEAFKAVCDKFAVVETIEDDGAKKLLKAVFGKDPVQE